MISLVTDRLELRNFCADDWQALQEVIVAYQASDSAQYEDPWPTSDEKLKEIAGWFAGGDDYLAVCLKDTGTLIGLVAVGRRQEQEQQIHNLGYVFHPGYAGQGYATESCRAAMGYLFEQLAAEGILTGTHPDNVPSVALLKRLGLREIGDGEWTLSKEEWLAGKGWKRMKTLEGIQWRPRYNEHMSCIKSCLEYLSIDLSYPWLYGGTGNAFVLNMNDTVFVDCAQAWDISMLFDLAPNVGFTVEQFKVEHSVALEMPDDEFLQKQREAFDFVQARIDRGLPCYAWELTHIPAYYVITGYNDTGYTYSGWDSSKRGMCPWDKLGTFDVKLIAVNCVHPGEPASDSETVKAAVTTVLERVERPEGWSIGPRYRTGLPAYDMWADALESGRANRDGAAYINRVWLECREMAVEFLQEAKARLPRICDATFDEAVENYGIVRDRLRALAELHPERSEGTDWTTTFASPEGAELVCEAASAERTGVACLRQIVRAL